MSMTNGRNSGAMFAMGIAMNPEFLRCVYDNMSQNLYTEEANFVK